MGSASALEIEFLTKYQGLLRKGLNICRICEERLAMVLGTGGASAAMFYIGEDCANPIAFLEKLKLLFKEGTSVLLLQLLDRDFTEGESA
jgi:hypothetical protein